MLKVLGVGDGDVLELLAELEGPVAEGELDDPEEVEAVVEPLIEICWIIPSCLN